MSDWLVREFRRAIAAEHNRGGMKVGMPHVRAEASRLARLCDLYEAQQAEIERLREDSERLKWLANSGEFFDEFCGVDLHEEASIYASALGRSGETNESDYLAAIRTAIDAGRAALEDKHD